MSTLNQLNIKFRNMINEISDEGYKVEKIANVLLKSQGNTLINRLLKKFNWSDLTINQIITNLKYQSSEYLELFEKVKFENIKSNELIVYALSTIQNKSSVIFSKDTQVTIPTSELIKKLKLLGYKVELPESKINNSKNAFPKKKS